MFIVFFMIFILFDMMLVLSCWRLEIIVEMFLLVFRILVCRIDIFGLIFFWNCVRLLMVFWMFCFVILSWVKVVCDVVLVLVIFVVWLVRLVLIWLVFWVRLVIFLVWVCFNCFILDFSVWSCVLSWFKRVVGVVGVGLVVVWVLFVVVGIEFVVKGCGGMVVIGVDLDCMFFNIFFRVINFSFVVVIFVVWLLICLFNVVWIFVFFIVFFCICMVILKILLLMLLMVFVKRFLVLCNIWLRVVEFLVFVGVDEVICFSFCILLFRFVSFDM